MIGAHSTTERATSRSGAASCGSSAVQPATDRVVTRCSILSPLSTATITPHEGASAIRAYTGVRSDGYRRIPRAKRSRGVFSMAQCTPLSTWRCNYFNVGRCGRIPIRVRCATGRHPRPFLSFELQRFAPHIIPRWRRVLVSDEARPAACNHLEVRGAQTIIGVCDAPIVGSYRAVQVAIGFIEQERHPDRDESRRQPRIVVIAISEFDGRRYRAYTARAVARVRSLRHRRVRCPDCHRD